MFSTTTERSRSNSWSLAVTNLISNCPMTQRFLFYLGIPKDLYLLSLYLLITPHETYSTTNYPSFGFDPKTNDYKVVMLKDLWSDRTGEPLRGNWIVELYSFNSNSWRNLGTKAIPFSFGTCDSYGFSTYVNNCCHWWGYIYRNEDEDVVEGVVLSFDMVTELFRKIKVPQITHSSGRCYEKLTAFIEFATIGFIALPACEVTEDSFYFDVWMMKDYMDDESWIKRYSVGSMPAIYKRLVGFYGSNRFLWKDANGTLVLYGLDGEEQTRDLRVYGNDESIRAVRYMESLVSLQRESFPQEMLSNVLSRLPAKELMRCKCVCKSWYDLIIDPHFISNYYLFYNSQEKQEQVLVIRNRKPDYFLSEFYNTKLSILSWNSNGLVSSQLLNPPPYHRCKGFGPLIMGPCNGIYFLEGIPRVIMNPSLSQFISLPQCQLPVPHGTFSPFKFPGFGFDPKTNDYKVVVLSEHWLDKPGEPLPGDWTVELYSLNSNSWRNLNANAIPFSFVQSDVFGFCTYVNNSCHWWGYMNESDKDESDDVENVVLSFDMVTELFRKIKVPQITYSSTGLTSFTELATIGLIALLSQRVTEDCFCFDVWMMKDYWDDESWIKRYSVGSMPAIYKSPVGYYGSNQFLWKDANDTLVLYGLDCEDHTRDLQFYGNHESIRGVKFMESLVSLRRGN